MRPQHTSPPYANPQDARLPHGAYAICTRFAARAARDDVERVAVALGAPGRPGTWRQLVFLPSRVQSATAFDVPGSAVLRLLTRARRVGLVPACWLHSHPRGAPRLSSVDRARFWPGGQALWPACWHAVAAGDTVGVFDAAGALRGTLRGCLGVRPAGPGHSRG